jgi:O-antigen/teichoic acid export membrane protein
VLPRLRSLGKSFTVYGLGDVATSVLSFLLLPLYARFLSPDDYGAIGLLLSVEVITKIVFRLGLDAAFMRLFYDCADDAARQRLASTVFWFLAAVGGAVVAVGQVFTPEIAAAMGISGYPGALRIVFVNTYIISFYFIPFHVMRMTDQPTTFVALTTSRAAATLLIRFACIVGFDLGVTGFVLADLAVSAVFSVVMLRWFRPLIRMVFSRTLIDEALRNGLPRVPHGIMQQAMFVADRYALRMFSALSEVGLYQMGASFGMALKLVLNAFEYAWAPFYYSTMKTPEAKATFRLITTYGVALLTLLVAGLAATGPAIVRWVLPAEFHGAAPVVPWVGLGVGFQGLYLLTSIGLNITKSTHYYPVATGAAAAASIGANVLLVPRFGSLGAAWANALAYFVMFATAFVLSQRVYPIPLEWGRLARIVAAGGAAFGASILVPALPPLASALVRGTVVTLVFPGVLAALGFLDARELRTLGRLADRVRALRAGPAPAAAASDVTLADDQQIP